MSDRDRGEGFLTGLGAVELGETHVTIEWGDGHRSVFSNRGLRESCPCELSARATATRWGPGS